jgi:uncharacterized membrane protein YfcA
LLIFLVLVALAAAFAGGVAAIAGFGIGSILTPVVATQFDMKTAVAAISIPHFVATAVRFARLYRHLDVQVFRTFGLVNAAGALGGALLHSRANAPALVYVLAVLLVFAGVMGLSGLWNRVRFGPIAAWIAGAASGAFGGLVGNQGGIRSAAMLGLGVQREAFVATATAIALLVDVARMPVYFLTESNRIFAARNVVLVALIGVLAGTLLGEHVLRRIPPQIFTKVVSALLLAIGIVLIATHHS